MSEKGMSKKRIVDEEVVPSYPEVSFAGEPDEPEDDLEGDVDDEDLVEHNTILARDLPDVDPELYPDYSNLGPTEPLGPAEPM